MNWPYPQNGELYVDLMQAVNTLSHLSRENVPVRKVELEGTQPVLWLYEAPPQELVPANGVTAMSSIRGHKFYAVHYRNCQLRWDAHGPAPQGDDVA